ncbi:MAG: hypothetical protein BWX64_02172 [Acidobacteria bacterium ADurb.Bin051]|nr:MAG: hypothetical protein BWX64_02172 [Acidobacteria bacterium ADurb.Bin051]
MVDEHRPTGIGHPGGVGLDPGPAGHQSQALLRRVLERPRRRLDGGVRLRGANRLSGRGQSPALPRQEGLVREEPHLLFNLRDGLLQLGDALARVLEVAVARSGRQQQGAGRPPAHPLPELRLVHPGEGGHRHVGHVLDVPEIAEKLVVREVEIGQVEQRRLRGVGRLDLPGVAGDERDLTHPDHRPRRFDGDPLRRAAARNSAVPPDLAGDPESAGLRRPVYPDPVFGPLRELAVLDLNPLPQPSLQQPPAPVHGAGPDADQILRAIAHQVGTAAERELFGAGELMLRGRRHVDEEQAEAIPPGVDEHGPEELVEVRPPQVDVFAPGAQSVRDVRSDPDRAREHLAHDLRDSARGRVVERRPPQPGGIPPRAREVLALVGRQILLPGGPDGPLSTPERAQQPPLILGGRPGSGGERHGMLLRCRHASSFAYQGRAAQEALARGAIAR